MIPGMEVPVSELHSEPPEPLSSPPLARARPALFEWVRQGLKAGLLMRPVLPAPAPRAMQLLTLVALWALLDIGLARLEVDGPAVFQPAAWLAPTSLLAVLALVLWVLLERSPRENAVGAWFLLWLPAALVPSLAWELLTILDAREALPAWLVDARSLGWVVYFFMLAWFVAIADRLGRLFGLDPRRLAGLALAVLVLYGAAGWQFPDRPWRAELVAGNEGGGPPPQAGFSQRTFEEQQAAWARGIDALAPQRPGVVDVYGIVFAPYAEEDVFLRESTMVSRVLAERFDAQGRVLHLVNHATTMATHPWATLENLKRAIDAVAQRMDPAEDVLVVYLTSHGAQNFQLAAAHPPLQVEPVTPTELRNALDEAGVRYRVVAVSACFSGGWVGPLASDGALVMTAADAEHTSYGCGRRSPLTFFGRAVFDEQLRRTHSFEEAFAAAVPVIRQREVDAKKPDGFSNPQISVGAAVRPVLDQLAKRLDQSAKP